MLLLAILAISGCSGGVSNTANTAPQKPARQPSQATFLAVGDIMLSRGVAGVINRAGDPLVPFSALDKEFLSTDFNFGNLESPISGNDS